MINALLLEPTRHSAIGRDRGIPSPESISFEDKFLSPPAVSIAAGLTDALWRPENTISAIAAVLAAISQGSELSAWPYDGWALVVSVDFLLKAGTW